MTSNQSNTPDLPGEEESAELDGGQPALGLYARLQIARQARRARRLRLLAIALIPVAVLIFLLVTLFAILPKSAPSPGSSGGLALVPTLQVTNTVPTVLGRATTAPTTSRSGEVLGGDPTGTATAAIRIQPATGSPTARLGTSVQASATNTHNPSFSPTPSTPSISPTPTPTGTADAANQQLPLLGRRIGLDPGHGVGSDQGVVLSDAKTGKLVLAAAEFNLDIALRCRDILLARGASVVLTRETAGTLTGTWPSDTNGDGITGASADDLQERIDIINNFHAEVFLSIQANGGTTSPVPSQDLEVFYCGTSECQFATQSKTLAQLVLDNLQKGLASNGHPAGGQAVSDLLADATVPPRHLFLLGPANPPLHVRSSGMPGVLSESLYVSSPQQAAELNDSGVRQAIALAYADALQAYLTGNKSGN